MLFSVVDDRSGVAYQEYRCVYGEDVAAALRFLFNAMAPKDEPGLVLQGIPAMLYLDNGPVAKSGVFKRVMAQLGVEVRTHMPRGSDGRRVTARAKGKVERPFFYLEQHFIKGHAWASFEAFHAGLRAFMAEDLDQRVHATTGEAPRERFAREQGALTPLPTHPFLSSREALRQVSWDCLISWQGSRYSVPWTAAGTQVWVRPVQGRQLVVRDQGGVELARHPLATQKGITVSEPHHYDGLRAGLPKTRVVLTDVFLARFPDHGWFLAELFAAHRPNGVAHLRAIVGLAELYPTERLVAAFAAARQYRSYAHGFIRGVLEAGGPAPAPADAHRPVPPPVADLGVYQRILEAAR